MANEEIDDGNADDDEDDDTSSADDDASYHYYMVLCGRRSKLGIDARGWRQRKRRP